ncbi:hypothetical protein [Ferruginibacter sp.]
MKIILLLPLLFMFTQAYTQSTVTVSINGIKKAEYTIKSDETAAGSSIKKADIKKMSRLTVLINGEQVNNAMYKKTLEAAGNDDIAVASAAQTAGVKGQFVFKNNKLKSLFSKGKSIKLYLMLEPADDKMMMPSKRIYMGTISVK